MLAAVFGAVILSTTLAVCFFCSSLPANRKYTLLALQMLILVIQCGQFLSLAATPAEIEFFVRTQTSGLCLLGLTYFLYGYVSAFHRYPTLSFCIAISIMPVAAVAFVWSDQLHHLFYTIYNTFYYRYEQSFTLVMIYNYLLALAGSALLGTKARGKWSFRQSIPAFGAVIFLMALDTFEFVGPRLSIYDLTPVGLAVAQISYLVARRPISGYHNVLRTRMSALNCIEQSVVITDRQNRILYHNESPLNVQMNLREGQDFVGIPSRGLVFEEKLESARVGEQVANGEFAYVFTGSITPRHYSYYVRTLGARKGQVAGLLYSFRDVSAYKELIEELNRRHHELAAASERLQEYSSIVERLAEEVERERVVRQVYDTVEEAVSRIVANLQEMESEEGPELMEHSIAECLEFARSSIREIRSSVCSLSAPSREEGYGR